MAQVKAKSDALQKVLQEVGTKVYQQAAQEYAKQQGQQQPGQAPPGEEPGPEMPPSGGPEPSGEEKVVDSEDYKVSSSSFSFLSLFKSFFNQKTAASAGNGINCSPYSILKVKKKASLAVNCL